MHGTVQENLAPRDCNFLPLAQGHDVLSEIIHEGNVGIENELGTHRGHAARQRGLRVKDCGGSRRNERSSALLVQVCDVNNGDFTALQARCQVRGAVVDADPAPSGLVRSLNVCHSSLRL